ncbi:MAG: heavy metal translocating P-type ATPase [Clostridia bacterium]|nr:heavy metal translocating P-type ATPase [Clostridia bacterium]
MGCNCNECHSHENKENGRLLPIVLPAVGTALIIVSYISYLNDSVSKIMLIAATAICGIPIFIDAVKSLKKKQITESFLLVVAVIAAFFLGEFSEAAVVSVLFSVGELMEDYASDKSRKSIEAIFGIISDEANLVKDDGTLEKMDADDVKIGDVLAVLPHEIVPVDGEVIKGIGSVDASALTGESMPLEVNEGSVVSSGMMNGDSTLFIRASAAKENSSATRIVELVEQATLKKGRAQRAVTTFAKYYTPAVIAAAVMIAVIPSLITGDWQGWIYKSLILLVASCPCAVVISAPLAFFSSMGAAAKNGMIIKGSRYIEALSKADTVVFDKTGTLTTGQLKVGKVYAADGLNADYVLNLAAKCEYYSSHPIARAIVAENGETDMSGVADFNESAGGGTSVTAPEGIIFCGGERYMNNNGFDISLLPKAPVYVALDGKTIGAIEIDGELRSEAPATVKKLRRLGVEHSLILTGDTAEQARKVCAKCGIDDFRSNLLPEDKLTALEEIKERANGVIYVGDGVNDAPVLAAADVGVAMGLGTQAACEAADIILTNTQLSCLSDTVYQSKRTMSVLKINIAFAIAVKFIVIVLGILGIAPMWSAIAADVGTMIVCVANAARLMKVKRY